MGEGVPGIESQRREDREDRLLEMPPQQLGLPDVCVKLVMRAAVAAGAGLINDVMALREPGALQAAADLGVPVVLMHMQGEPETMQKTPHYADVVAEVVAFLERRIAACEQAGIARNRLLVDPGFGFGKTLAHNLELLRRGLAWHYKTYEREQPASERHAYAQAERQARADRQGLWSDEQPIAPWDYRKGRRP